MIAWRDWSQLPPELVEKIAGGLTEIPDLIRFRFVCVSWRSASKSLTANLPPQLPWLLLDSAQASNNSSYKCRFFSLSENRIYRIPLPQSRTQDFFSSSPAGWLAVGGGGSLSLLNPMTRRSIPLPPLLLRGKPGRPWTPPVRKLKLFESDLVAAFCPDMHSIFYSRLGDATWKAIFVSSSSGDFAYHNGSFFVLNRNVATTIEVFDVLAVKRARDIPAVRPYSWCCRQYLVELPSGELLLVLRHENGPENLRNRFELFQLDTSEEKLKWAEVNNIGDCVLFVDADNAVCFASSDFEGCRWRRNHIYFGVYNESRKMGSGRPKNVGMWSFDVESGQVERAPLFSDYPRTLWAWAMWVIPSLC